MPLTDGRSAPTFCCAYIHSANSRTFNSRLANARATADLIPRAAWFFEGICLEAQARRLEKITARGKPPDCSSTSEPIPSPVIVWTDDMSPCFRIALRTTVTYSDVPYHTLHVEFSTSDPTRTSPALNPLYSERRSYVSLTTLERHTPKASSTVVLPTPFTPTIKLKPGLKLNSAASIARTFASFSCVTLMLHSLGRFVR